MLTLLPDSCSLLPDSCSLISCSLISCALDARLHFLIDVHLDEIANIVGREFRIIEKVLDDFIHPDGFHDNLAANLFAFFFDNVYIWTF